MPTRPRCFSTWYIWCLTSGTSSTILRQESLETLNKVSGQYTNLFIHVSSRYLYKYINPFNIHNKSILRFRQYNKMCWYITIKWRYQGLAKWWAYPAHWWLVTNTCKDKSIGHLKKTPDHAVQVQIGNCLSLCRWCVKWRNVLLIFSITLLESLTEALNVVTLIEELLKKKACMTLFLISSIEKARSVVSNV